MKSNVQIVPIYDNIDPPSTLHSWYREDPGTLAFLVANACPTSGGGREDVGEEEQDSCLEEHLPLGAPLQERFAELRSTGGPQRLGHTGALPGEGIEHQSPDGRVVRRVIAHVLTC
eukprot:s130_g7.t1